MFKTIIEGLEEYKKEVEKYAEASKAIVKQDTIGWWTYTIDELTADEEEKKHKQAEEKYNRMTEQQRFRASPYSRNAEPLGCSDKLAAMAQALGLTPEEEFEIKAKLKIKLGYPASYFPFVGTEIDRLRGKGIRRS